MRTARPVRLAMWTISGLLGLATVLAIVGAAQQDKTDDPYQLDCASSERSVHDLDFGNDKVSVFDTPEAAIEASDLPKFIDVPADAWDVGNEEHPVTRIAESASVNQATDGTESGVRNFVLYVDSSAKVDLQLEPVSSGYRLTGWVGC